MWGFFGIEGHVVLDRNLGPGYNALCLQLILGDRLSACLHRQFNTLPDLLESGFTVKLLPITPACQAGMQFVPIL